MTDPVIAQMDASIARLDAAIADCLTILNSYEEKPSRVYLWLQSIAAAFCRLYARFW